MSEMATNGRQPEAFLRDCYVRLRRNERHDIGFGPAWAKRLFPPRNGVYLVFEDGKPAYVGESSDMRERLAELGSVHNHPLPRHIVERHHPSLWRERERMDHREFATAVRIKARAWMQKHMSVAYIEIPLGRAELEGYVIPRLDNKRRYNKPARRGLMQRRRLASGESYG